MTPATSRAFPSCSCSCSFSPASLRLTGGSLRGRRLAAPSGQGVRPTSDRARETLFNVLTNRFKRPGGQSVLSEARVLDAFAGTGALGLEALSRGAAFAAFAEPRLKSFSATTQEGEEEEEEA